MKNIIFLSQKGFFGKVDRKTTTHLPVDSAQQTILQADNCHYSQINKIPSTGALISPNLNDPCSF